MNIDHLLLDIVKDKIKTGFNTCEVEGFDDTGMSRDQIKQATVYAWFGLKADTRLSIPANRTPHSSMVTKSIREILPIDTKVRPLFYLQTLKQERDKLLSNIDD